MGTSQQQGLHLRKPTQKPERLICKCSSSDYQELRPDNSSVLIEFGPCYRGNNFWMSIKEAAWEHVLQESTKEKAQETKQAQIIQSYVSAIRMVAKEARDMYAESVVDDLTDHDFMWMMIKDGCLLLQLALLVLGGTAQLRYPKGNFIFGKKPSKREIKIYVESIFFVGNQIPLVVLRKLMMQNFFQDVVSGGEWKRPSELSRRALYELLLLPALEVSHKNMLALLLWPRICPNLGRAKKLAQWRKLKQPSDLLHGLQSLVLGPSSTASPALTEEDLGKETVGEGEGKKFPNARELKRAGISFRKGKEGMGIRGTKFSSNIFRAVLTMPSFTVDDDTEMLFRYLKYYESNQKENGRENKCEVTSYLRFMNEIVGVAEDARLLAAKGIVRANPNQREKLPGILRSMACDQTSHSLSRLRLQINDYSRIPWEKIGHFVILVILISLLTVLQTVYTVLGYYKKGP